jgi:hypothetical protein
VDIDSDMGCLEDRRLACNARTQHRKALCQLALGKTPRQQHDGESRVQNLVSGAASAEQEASGGGKGSKIIVGLRGSGREEK